MVKGYLLPYYLSTTCQLWMSQKKKKKPKDLLEEMATRKKLDMPYELSLQANDIKVLHQINDSESSVSLLS